MPHTNLLSHKLVHVWQFWEQQQLPKYKVAVLDIINNSDTVQEYIITLQQIVIFCCFPLNVAKVLTYTVYFKFLCVFILICYKTI